MLNMDMKKIQELPTPEDLKKEFPLPYKVQKIKKQRDQEIEDIFTGKDDRLILIIRIYQLSYLNVYAFNNYKFKRHFLSINFFTRLIKSKSRLNFD